MVCVVFVQELDMDKSLKKGESLFKQGDSGMLWRVESGLILLQKTTDDGDELTQIALSGDVIGLEALCDQAYANTAIALIDSHVSRLRVANEFNAFAAMAKGYMQQQQRMHDMSKLRTGSVASRLRHFIQMLSKDLEGKCQSLNRKDLPTLREMSHIIDIADETICRELKAFFPQERKANPLKVGVGSDAFALAA